MRIVRTIRTIEQVREYSVPAHITSEDAIFDYIAGVDEEIESETVIDEVLDSEA